jgi:hypothetical protein
VAELSGRAECRFKVSLDDLLLGFTVFTQTLGSISYQHHDVPYG